MMVTETLREQDEISSSDSESESEVGQCKVLSKLDLAQGSWWTPTVETRQLLFALLGGSVMFGCPLILKIRGIRLGTRCIRLGT